MSIHYKFKAAKDFDTITFDGQEISLGELKSRIIEAKALGKPGQALDFDLAVVNAQTNEEYAHDGAMIRRNTSVIIRRVPVTRHVGQPGSKLMSSSAPIIPASSSLPPPKPAAMMVPMMPKPAATLDPNKTDAEKVSDVINQSGGWHQRPVKQPFQRFGKVFPGQNAPPAHYICYRCNKPGHFISDCPTNGDPAFDVHKVKKATGIPRSFLKPVAAVGEVRSTLILPNGSLAVMQPNSRDFNKVQAVLTTKIEREKIPAELQCGLCLGLMREAVSTPCCNQTFCDECIRRSLLEPTTGAAPLTCPNCSTEGISPDSLQPNKDIRDRVDTYRKTLPNQALKPAAQPSIPDQSAMAARVIPTVDLSDEQKHPPSISGTARPIDTGGEIEEPVVVAPIVAEPPKRKRNPENAAPVEGGERVLPKGKPTDLCYNCRQYGHFARDCPMPAAPRGEFTDKNAYIQSLVDAAVIYFAHTPRNPPPTKEEIEQYRELSRKHFEQQLANWHPQYPAAAMVPTTIATTTTTTTTRRSRSPSPPRRTRSPTKRSSSPRRGPSPSRKSPSRRSSPTRDRSHHSRIISPTRELYPPVEKERRRDDERRRSPDRSRRVESSGETRERERHEREKSKDREVRERERRDREYRRDDRDHHHRR